MVRADYNRLTGPLLFRSITRLLSKIFIKLLVIIDLCPHLYLTIKSGYKTNSKIKKCG